MGVPVVFFLIFGSCFSGEITCSVELATRANCFSGNIKSDYFHCCSLVITCDQG